MEENGGRRRPLVVLPFHGHMTPVLQLASALHYKGFSIAIAHSKLNAPDPSNHPSDFTFLPLSDSLSMIDYSNTFTNFINTLNADCKPSFKEHLIRLISEGNKPIAVIYDNVMLFAGHVALDLNLVPIVFRITSAVYLPAILARQQLHPQGRYLQDDFVMQEMIPNHHPLRYKDLPFSNSSNEDFKNLLDSNFSPQALPSAVILNTIQFLEHEALTRVNEHYQVPVFTPGPLHKMAPSPPAKFLEEDTSCINWLDKQAPKSVIYISFGSLATLDAKVLTEMAWGLADSEQRFLWAVRPGSVSDLEWIEFLPKGFLEATREQGLIVKWAPQREVLAHFAVGGFWSHCGWNSTLECISEGVPMICQPFIADQGVNARYVSYVWKIGLELECFERREIAGMIRRVMLDEGGGKEIRIRVNNMKELVKQALDNGGTSHESLESLVSFILS